MTERDLKKIEEAVKEVKRRVVEEDIEDLVDELRTSKRRPRPEMTDANLGPGSPSAAESMGRPWNPDTAHF